MEFPGETSWSPGPQGQTVEGTATVRQAPETKVVSPGKRQRFVRQKKSPSTPRNKKTLVDLGYKVFLGVLNSQDFKVPQQRQRLFVVAIRKDSYRRAFKWPKKLGKRTLSEVLDPLQSFDQPGRLPKAKRAKALALRAFKKVYKNGTDPRKVPVAIDTGCSMKYATFGVNVSRTLCQARAKTGGFWISNRGRVMSTTEMMKVSGLNDGEMDGWQNHVTPAQFQGMLGNCVPVPLVGSVLQNALIPPY